MRTVVGGGRDTHDGHENSPILVFFSNLLDGIAERHLVVREPVREFESHLESGLTVCNREPGVMGARDPFSDGGVRGVFSTR